jgi:prepilin-type N-terminal cleavage/methylation domain-containing protein
MNMNGTVYSRLQRGRRAARPSAFLNLVRRRLTKQQGFTIVELMLVILIGSLISVAVLVVLRGSSTVFNSQEVRILNQDDARLAINQMSRFIRMAASSADNRTTVSNAIATALPFEIEFYCDVDGDGVTDKVRYYLAGSELRSQTEAPVWVETPTPGWQYGAYESDGVVIENRVRNDTEAMFTYYRYDGAGALEAFSPVSEADKEEVITVTLTIKVGERPDLAPKDVVLSTDVQIRQRYEGGLK